MRNKLVNNNTDDRFQLILYDIQRSYLKVEQKLSGL